MVTLLPASLSKPVTVPLPEAYTVAELPMVICGISIAGVAADHGGGGVRVRDHAGVIQLHPDTACLDLPLLVMVVESDTETTVP